MTPQRRALWDNVVPTRSQRRNEIRPFSARKTTRCGYTARIGGGFVWTTVTGGSTISSALSLPLFSWAQRREMRPRGEWGAHSRRALLQFEYDRCPMSYLAHPLPPLSRQERDVSFSA